MSNPHFNSDVHNRSNSPTPPSHPKGGSQGKLNMSPAFGKVGLPGKPQPKSRNAGVKKIDIYPESQGL